MSVKEIYAPHIGRGVKFGRQIPDIILPHPKMTEFELSTKDETVILPTPPNTIDWTPAALSALKQLFLNDTVGDCVIAAIMHALGVWTGNAGSLVTASDAQVLAGYEAIGGYVPGQPNTDNGCNIQTMFNYYMANPLPDGSKLLGYVGVDPTNPTQVMRSIDLFENLILGLALPDGWICHVVVKHRLDIASVISIWLTRYVSTDSFIASKNLCITSSYKRTGVSSPDTKSVHDSCDDVAYRVIQKKLFKSR